MLSFQLIVVLLDLWEQGALKYQVSGLLRKVSNRIVADKVKSER